MNGTYLHQKLIPRIIGKIRESMIIKYHSKMVVFELTLRGDTGFLRRLPSDQQVLL